MGEVWWIEPIITAVLGAGTLLGTVGWALYWYSTFTSTAKIELAHHEAQLGELDTRLERFAQEVRARAEALATGVENAQAERYRQIMMLQKQISELRGELSATLPRLDRIDSKVNGHT